MSGLIQRHDQFLKRLLDQPGAAGALLRERLPPEVARLLSDEAPELVPGSLVSPELAEYRTDRLYRARTKAGRPLLVFALVEHKSDPDLRIGLQLLGYKAQILLQWDAREGRGSNGKQRPLPAVISLVIYNGRRPWKVPLTLAGAVETDPELHPYLIDFRYTLVDLSRIEDSELSRATVLRIGFLILKHGSGRDDLRATLLKLGRAALQLGFDDLVALVRYVLSEPNQLEAEVLRDVLAEIMPGQEQRVMSIALEQWKAKFFHDGLTEGLSRGISQGLSQGISQGLSQGMHQGKAELLLRLMRKRFGSVPPVIEERTRAASNDQLDDWSEKFLEARSVDDVFDGRIIEGNPSRPEH